MTVEIVSSPSIIGLFYLVYIKGSIIARGETLEKRVKHRIDAKYRLSLFGGLRVCHSLSIYQTV